MVNHSEVNISHRKKHGVWFKWCLQTNQKPMKYYNEKYRGEEERSFPKLSDVWLHRSPCDTGTSIHSLYKTILTISNSMVPANWEKSHDLLSLSILTFYFLLQTYATEIYGGIWEEFGEGIGRRIWKEVGRGECRRMKKVHMWCVVISRLSLAWWNLSLTLIGGRWPLLILFSANV